MNAQVDFMAAERNRFREQRCKKSEDGDYLCQCGATLSDTDFIACHECRVIDEEKARREAAIRRQQEDDGRIRSSCNQAFAAIPDWKHVRTPEDFQTTITHVGFRAVAARWPMDRSLLLVGPSGSGKTSTVGRACWREREARETGVLALSLRDRRMGTQAPVMALSELSRVAWTTASEIVRTIRGHRLGSGECQEITTFVEAPLLVIDELGPEAAHYTGEIFDIIDRRYAKARPTVVTSGLTVPAFKDRYGDAMFRRLTGEGHGLLVDAHQKAANGS